MERSKEIEINYLTQTIWLDVVISDNLRKDAILSFRFKQKLASMRKIRDKFIYEECYRSQLLIKQAAEGLRHLKLKIKTAPKCSPLRPITQNHAITCEQRKKRRNLKRYKGKAEEKHFYFFLRKSKTTYHSDG